MLCVFYAVTHPNGSPSPVVSNQSFAESHFFLANRKPLLYLSSRISHCGCIVTQRVTHHSLLSVILQQASHLVVPDLCARGCTRFPRERAAFTVVVDDGEGVGSRVEGRQGKGREKAAAERQEEEWCGAGEGGGGG